MLQVLLDVPSVADKLAERFLQARLWEDDFVQALTLIRAEPPPGLLSLSKQVHHLADSDCGIYLLTETHLRGMLNLLGQLCRRHLHVIVEQGSLFGSLRGHAHSHGDGDDISASTHVLDLVIEHDRNLVDAFVKVFVRLAPPSKIAQCIAHINQTNLQGCIEKILHAEFGRFTCLSNAGHTTRLSNFSKPYVIDSTSTPRPFFFEGKGHVHTPPK
ncbi:hypothetical protein xavtCFBP7764_22455 [Xanthomonas citri]|nr:hypothetical protein xavtCFBP7764_22455 [Xanthomonas citri]